MPISPIKLQRRQAELGRIRLGYKEPITTRGGRPGSRPAKLDRFRFTSPSETYIRDLATLYGGEAKAWDNDGKAEWEVITDATSIPVIVTKGGMSQWMETWSGGGCVHRCDGEIGVDGEPCNPDDPAHVNAKPTTRLSVMLTELESVGVFRLESHGWNAAAEIPAVAELAQYVGDLVPAHLRLVERRVIKDGKTSRFVVPVLDLQIGRARLLEIASEKAGLSIEAPTATAAIEAPATVTIDYRAIADTLLDLGSLTGLWAQARENGHLTEEVKAYLTNRADQIKATEAEEPVDAEIVDDTAATADPDVIWQQILKAGADEGMTLADVQDDFAREMKGLTADSAGAPELQHYLDILTRRVPA